MMLNGAITLRPAKSEDFDRICALNQAEVQHTSAMDGERLTLLNALSCYHTVVEIDGQVVAFLLAMKNDADYKNPNFEWFSRHYPQFIYIDRVVVAEQFRGYRLATLLYEDLFRFARAKHIGVICCEYNIVPANDASRLFHDKFDFKEQGRQWLGDNTKQVSLQVAEV